MAASDFAIKYYEWMRVEHRIECIMQRDFSEVFELSLGLESIQHLSSGLGFDYQKFLMNKLFCLLPQGVSEFTLFYATPLACSYVQMAHVRVRPIHSRTDIFCSLASLLALRPSKCWQGCCADSRIGRGGRQNRTASHAQMGTLLADYGRVR